MDLKSVIDVNFSDIILCKDEFWNRSRSWDADIPQLSSCFRETFLPTVPILSLILFLPVDYGIFWDPLVPSIPLPWQWTNITRFALNFIMIVTSLVHLTNQIMSLHGQIILSQFISPTLHLFTFTATLILSIHHRRVGRVMSPGLNIFWLINGLVTLLTLHSEWIDQPRSVLTIIFTSYSTLSFLAFIVSSLSDKHLNYHRIESQDNLNPCPLADKSFFSRLSYSYLLKQIWVARNSKLDKEHLIPTCGSFQAAHVFQQFHKIDSRVNSNFDCLSLNIKQKKLIPVIARFLALPITLAFLFEFFVTIVSYGTPLGIGYLVDFLSSDEPKWHGFIYLIMLIFGVSVSELMSNSLVHMLLGLSIKVYSALCTAIYRKIFSLSPEALKDITAGQVINHMSQDSMDIFWFVLMASNIPLVPIGIAMNIYLLWAHLGVSCLSSLGVIIFLSPLIYYMGLRSSRCHDIRMKFKDQRTAKISEILNSIRVVKLYAWEFPFINSIAKVRNKELIETRRMNWWELGFDVLSNLTVVLMTAVCFTIYALVDRSNVLDAKTIFVCLSLFSLLKWPIAALPETFVLWSRAIIAIRRISKFLSAQELPPRILSKKSSPTEPLIKINNVDFSWDLRVKPSLSNINLNVDEGSLIMIVGKVGCGKSSLLSAITGEMFQLNGEVKVSGSIAYVPQTAWIQNTSVKANILFLNDFEEERYQRVIRSCDLKSDLEILVAGDETEIGEKGINLSGGQKQRISLARAIYNDAEIYLLDDPLSAVDANVAEHIFVNVIGPTGVLNGKTRILVTHSLKYLPYSDFVIVMEDGKIKACGSYHELSSKKLISRESFAQASPGNSSKSKQASKDKPVVRYRNRTVSSSSAASRTSLASSSSKKCEKLHEDKDLIKEEEYEMGSVSWRLYFSYIKSTVVYIFLISLLFILIQNIGEAGTTWWLGVSSKNPEPGTKTRTLLIYGGFIAVELVFSVIGGLLIFVGAMKASIVIHEKLLLAILRCPLLFFDTTPIGRILNRFSSDMEQIDMSIPQQMLSFLNVVCFNTLALMMITYKFPYLLIIIFVVAVAQGFISKYYLWTSRQLKRLQMVAKSPLFSIFGETLNGAPTIKAYGVKDQFILTCYSRIDGYISALYNQYMVNRWLSSFLVIFNTLFLFCVVLVFIIEKEKLSPQTGGIIITYTIQVLLGVTYCVRVITSLETAMVSYERLKEYSASKPEADWESHPNHKPPAFWPSSGEVEFQNYSTSYRNDGELVLKNLNFHVKPREKVGIVGRTGAGKSSMVLSLFRVIEPTHGTILIDGVDIMEIGLHDLRSKLNIIPQDPVLFAESIRINLDPFEEHTDDELWSALEQAHLKEHIQAKPEGLNWLLEETGRNLSAGQRQLLCLARALLRCTKIVILDEATACIDNETDELIQKTIRQSFANSTILTIAHRIRTIIDYDKILVLSHGEVVEFDSPGNLLSKPESHFYKLAKEAGLI